jgi:hypothetical protein
MAVLCVMGVAGLALILRWVDIPASWGTGR